MDDMEFDEYWRLVVSTLSTLTCLLPKTEVANFFEKLLLIYTNSSRQTQESLRMSERAVSWESQKYLMK
jgi:hypothetical protein